MKFVPGRLPAIHQDVRKSLPQLPNEIWIHINGFLEKEDLAKIFSLSPVLLDIWRTVYAEVKVCSMKTPLRILNSMTALAATYVSKLLICPQFFDNLPLALPLSSGKTGSSAIAFLQTKAWIGHPKATQINIRILLEKITHMVNLKTIVVDCIHGRQSWKYFKQADAFIDAARTHSSRLENLELHLPFEYLEKTLITEHSIPNLKSLTISIWMAVKYVISIQPRLARLVQFINLYAPSLERLSLDNPDSSLNIMTILPSLGHITNLREIHFGLDNRILEPNTETRAQVEKFLHTYAQQLERLDILVYGLSLNTIPEPFEYDLFRVNFPLLKTLQVALKELRYLPSSTTFFTPPVPVVSSYLTQQRSILQNLVLKTHQVSAEEIEMVATALGGATSSLTSLAIQLEVFDPDLLSILASNLLNLCNLDIGVTNLHDPSFQLTTSIKRQRFLDAMSNTHPTLDAWGLRQFSFFILYDLECWVHIRQAVLQKLPNVITFNGYTRDEAMSARVLLTR